MEILEMIKFFRSHHRIFKIVIAFLVILFLIAIGDFIHYSKRINQINEKLNEYGNISYSVQKIYYPHLNYGPLTEIVYSNQHDTFMLHDNENDFDFTVSIRDQGVILRSDNYLECYLGNRFAEMCKKELIIPQDCEIKEIRIIAEWWNYDKTKALNLWKKMSDEELKQIKPLQFTIHLEVQGDQTQSEHLYR